MPFGIARRFGPILPRDGRTDCWLLIDDNHGRRLGMGFQLSRCPVGLS